VVNFQVDLEKERSCEQEILSWNFDCSFAFKPIDLHKSSMGEKIPEATYMSCRLKGKNQIRQFRQVAERLLFQINACSNVAGIVFLGGLARGFADKYSDVDVTVFLARKDELLRKKIRLNVLQEQKQSGSDVDLEIHYLNDFKEKVWDETDRWDFSHAEVVFDPEDQIKRMLEAKLKVPEEFWVRRVVVCAEYMRWYCCPTQKNIDSIAEAWIDRGDMLSAHYCLNYAIEMILEATFALNKEFLPPQKWRMSYFQSLKWIPKNSKLLHEAIKIKDITAEDFDRRINIVRKIWQGVLRKIEEEIGLLSDEITKYYVEKVLCQASVP
jgi:predicted nucleotidyltransferase